MSHIPLQILLPAAWTLVNLAWTAMNWRMENRLLKDFVRREDCDIYRDCPEQCGLVKVPAPAKKHR